MEEKVTDRQLLLNFISDLKEFWPDMPDEKHVNIESFKFYKSGWNFLILEDEDSRMQVLLTPQTIQLECRYDNFATATSLLEDLIHRAKKAIVLNAKILKDESRKCKKRRIEELKKELKDLITK